MSGNPSCQSNCVPISGCSADVPKLLFAKFADVSGCSEYDGKVVQLLNNSATGFWEGDDADFTISIFVDDQTMMFNAQCGDDMMSCNNAAFGDCLDPVGGTHSCSFMCCGEINITISQYP